MLKFDKDKSVSDNQYRKPTAMESNHNPFGADNVTPRYSLNQGSVVDSEAGEDNFLQKIGFEAEQIKKSREGSVKPKPSFKVPQPKKIKSNKVSVKDQQDIEKDGTTNKKQGR